MDNIEAAMKRIPPHSIEAEQAVLGAMLMNKDAVMVASEMLSGEDFYQTAYGILFDAVVELFKAGRPVDLITLQEHLKEKDVPPEISSMEYARELLAGTQTSANIKYYAEIVKDKAILRRLIKINEETATRALMVLPLAGKPTWKRNTTPPSGRIRQALRSRISWPQRLTEMRPLFPEPLAWKENFPASRAKVRVRRSCRAIRR